MIFGNHQKSFQHQQVPQVQKPQRVPLSLLSNGTGSTPPNPNNQNNQKPILCRQLPYKPFVHVELPIGLPCDPQDVTEFEHIIYRSMRVRETNLPEFTVQQTEMTPNDRSTMVLWLCRMHYKCQLTTETFHRSIGILDRVISRTNISRCKLPLIGSAAMLIASKIEDIQPIQIEDILTIAENAFTENDLKSMEVNLINLIGFDTEFPTILFFLSIFLRLNGQTLQIMLFARYITEICMTSAEFMSVKPSAIAATALMMTRTIAGVEPWTEPLAAYTQYSFEDLCHYCKVAHALLLQVGKDEANFIRRKYSIDQFCNVSCIQIPTELPIPFPYYD
ncbi:Cyclin, N-terminal domain containing protein [Histomonas meleagridis]|uniref:Cyclin, N-terminal domain containing protein n=1 Tax=Histomonas meleagridis TaxID=135588 RepID=UPI00355A541C|nr:Cyclin, N-terminal domain containing protein [Histomonas meleagridis]KAH0804350.1 Cyclin, N-terminal domain containing protein [Histomonas meleagridis]